MGTASYKVYDVFISYRRRESDGREQGTIIAQAIYQYLTSKGLKVFLDKECMETGLFPEQLQWQVSHAPNYLFIATNDAIHFRDVEPPDVDYVAEEVRLALDLFQKHPEDRMILPIIPYDVQVPAESDTSYPDEIHPLFRHDAGQKLESDIPTEKELKGILKKVTEVKRRNLWNAGWRWYDQAKQEGSRFAGLNIDKTIMPLAGKQPKENIRLPIHVHLQDQEDEPLMDMIANNPGNLYLVGEGGIGKTTALFSIMEEIYGPGNDENDIDRHRMSGQVPIFIELSKAPDTYGRLYEGGHSTFIKRAVYQQLRTDLKAKQVSGSSVEEIQEVFSQDPETAVKPIMDLFTQKTPAPEYLLLLDGLNEVSRTEIRYKTKDGDGTELTGKSTVVSMILEEISELITVCPNVRVILTSRSKEVTNWGDKITLLWLSGIDYDTVYSFLLGMKLPEERIDAVLHNKKLMEILRIPLFLTMYASLEGDENILTRGEILHLFFQKKKEKLYTMQTRTESVEDDVKQAASAKQPNRLTAEMQSFILDFILPEIAWEMVKSEGFYLTKRGKPGREGLRNIIMQVLDGRGNLDICGENGIDAFNEHYRDSRQSSTLKTSNEIITKFKGHETDAIIIREAIVDGVLECCVKTLGIMLNDRNEYGFIHHHIRDYFAAVNQINKLRLAVFLQDYGDGDNARSCLIDWQAHPLPQEILRFIGESLGEAHNKPRFDLMGNCHYNVPMEPCDRNLIRRAFDNYRGRFEAQDGYAIWNLLEILKLTRDDLRGADLTNLDLSLCEVNGHKMGGQKCAARLKGSRITEKFLMPQGHLDFISSAMYAPDGKRIITASFDNTSKIWDAETLQEIGTLEGNEDGVISAVYSPDGKHIVSIDCESVVKVWDAETLQEIFSLEDQLLPDCLSQCSPNGKYIYIIFDDHTIKVWDTETLREIGTLRKQINAFFSSDGKRILTEDEEHTIAVRDSETLQVIGILKEHNHSSLRDAVFSPHGSYILTLSIDGTLTIWNAETTKRICKKEEIIIQGEETKTRFSTNEKQIVAVSDKGILKILDTETLQEIETLDLASKRNDILPTQYHAEFSPDGKYILTSVRDNTITTVWDAENLQWVGMLIGGPCAENSAEYSPDGKRIITVLWNNTVKVWDMMTLQEVGTLKGYKKDISSIMYSPDGKHILMSCGYDTAKIWDTETLRFIGTLRGQNLIEFSKYSPDGTRIITFFTGGPVKVWDAETLQEIGTLECGLHSAVFSPDGKRIITISGGENTRIWDTETLQAVGTLNDNKHGFSSAMYSPDGKRILTVSDDHSVKVWNAETLEETGTVGNQKLEIKCAVFSPDGKYILTVSDDHSIKKWDAQTLQEINISEANLEFGWSLKYSIPEGKSIIGQPFGNEVDVLDAESFQHIGTLEGHNDAATDVANSPDGKRFATSSLDGTAKVWDAESYKCIHTIHNIPGLEVAGLDLRYLNHGSRLSKIVKEALYEYGAIVDERG